MVSRLITHRRSAALSVVLALALVSIGSARAIRTAVAQSSPASDSLVGQRVTTCWYGTHLAVQVTRTLWTTTLDGVSARGNGMWLVAFVDGTNLDNESGNGIAALKLRDERGREFSHDSPGTNQLSDLQDQYGAVWENASFDPGITQSAFVTFQVAPDVRTLTLVPDPSQCG